MYDMTFGEAVQMMKTGYKVTREGWNGKGMYLFLYSPKYDVVDPDGIVFSPDKQDPFVYMKTAQNTVIPWLCSQSDMQAEDWMITMPTEDNES